MGSLSSQEECQMQEPWECPLPQQEQPSNTQRQDSESARGRCLHRQQFVIHTHLLLQITHTHAVTCALPHLDGRDAGYKQAKARRMNTGLMLYKGGLSGTFTHPNQEQFQQWFLEVRVKTDFSQWLQVFPLFEILPLKPVWLSISFASHILF